MNRKWPLLFCMMLTSIIAARGKDAFYDPERQGWYYYDNPSRRLTPEDMSEFIEYKRQEIEREKLKKARQDAEKEQEFFEKEQEESEKAQKLFEKAQEESEKRRKKQLQKHLQKLKKLEQERQKEADIAIEEFEKEEAEKERQIRKAEKQRYNGYGVCKKGACTLNCINSPSTLFPPFSSGG